MSMLAEPRRKQKWSVDPRNSAWSKDDSKFGQKMLERMGWSKGKQGSTEHIKVKVKNDNLGLGTNASYEDDFNQLLADLNNCHSQNNDKETPSEEKQSFSLEEKSKTSRKRVHYMKFTKGKDLSCRSKTDLNCIFGKRAKHANGAIKEEENNGRDSQGTLEVKKEVKTEVKEEEEEQAIFAGPQPDLDVEGITKTVTSALTMQQYFAQRMARLRKSRGGPAQDPASSLGSSVPTETTDATDTTTTTAQEPDDINHAAENNPDEEPKKKSKKNKKKNKQRKIAEEEEVKEVVVAAAEVEDEESHQEPVSSEKRRRKKKNKRKAAELEEAVPDDSSATLATRDGDGGGVEENPGKKRKTNELCTESNLDEGHAVEDPTVQSDGTNNNKKKTKKKKKKQKHATQVDSEVAEEEVAVVPERKSKKAKKKRE
ncbi:hypothetical protein CRUP_036172 [Coryphaenoides rupestris]|nr:hypothetical protein CRUP_036172 [Coryphaenoides rupestris]